MSTEIRKVAQAALDTLEQLQGGCTDHDDGTIEAITVWCPEVLEDLRAALAQPQAEPVAWMVYSVDGGSVRVTDNPAEIVGGERALPLFTGPVVGTDGRECTCHSDDRPPNPCPRKFAYSECVQSAPPAQARMLSDEEIRLLVRDSIEGVTVAEAVYYKTVIRAAIRAFCKIHGIEVRDE